eukprot:4711192-Prymnesium_polylepis.1
MIRVYGILRPAAAELVSGPMTLLHAPVPPSQLAVPLPQALAPHAVVHVAFFDEEAVRLAPVPAPPTARYHVIVKLADVFSAVRPNERDPATTVRVAVRDVTFINFSIPRNVPAEASSRTPEVGVSFVLTPAGLLGRGLRRERSRLHAQEWILIATMRCLRRLHGPPRS